MRKVLTAGNALGLFAESSKVTGIPYSASLRMKG